MEYHTWCVLAILFLIGSNRKVVLGTHEEDSWVEPDIWGREQHQNNQHYENSLQNAESTSDSKCEMNIGSSQSGDAIALMYYKRLIAYLFNNDFFKHDEVSGKYIRALVLTALPAQLEQLKSLDDPRDLDNVLSEILTRARTATKDDIYMLYDDDKSSMNILGTIWHIVKYLAQLLKASEVQFLLGAASAVLFGWYCHRKYHIGIIAMIIGAVVCFGYFHTYLECNRKLEAEHLLEMLARHEQLMPSEPRWYSPIINFFTSSEQSRKQEKKEYIKKASQLNLNFCRPDHVFLMYANDLFLKQLGFLIDKSAETMEMLRDNLSFPFNYLAAVLLMFLIAYILKLTFKYILSPRAWAGLRQPGAIGSHAPQYSGLPSSSGTAHHEDRISGENLRMLLNAISGGATSNQITISNTTATAALTQPPDLASGVQEILNSLENTSSADTGSESSSPVVPEKSKQNSPQQQVATLDNNNEHDKQLDVSADSDKCKEVQVEDVLDEEA
ncbi:uncharacterized protein LOC128855929 [Anastrepha ludens]|uniref:uncharacterized protein LOC128855929 n=1 Tax=Anastrepha ludens TaxID=28586 RepID=UPI0023B05027|nr:uncharacterized protein LOC128855929 [Anastrepha ludens]XP_053947155.1 uncharacterized protein LOC128855929 [Anastrepha ludens]